METWILPITVNPKKKYWYDIDGALNSKELRGTIYQVQNIRIKNISVGDIVYLYETIPVQKICWKCQIIAVKVPYEKISDIDDSEFEHGKEEPADSYVKITVIGRYDDEPRKKLSLAELRGNGLKSNLQGTERVSIKPQLLKYINSIKALPVFYDD